MTDRFSSVARIVIVAALSALVPIGAARAQTAGPPAAKPAAARTFVPPKTPWGEPDLQGLYSNKTITPLERPAQFAGQSELTVEEIAALESRAAARSVDNGRAKGTEGDVTSAYNEFWWDRGKKVTTNRSSLIVDPPDGRVPALTADAQRRAAEEYKQPIFRGGGANGRGSDWTTDRSLFERCITRGLPGAMSPSAYNNTYRIVQSPGVVAIQIEMLGGTRVIPITADRHVGAALRQYMGDSRGHWEGNTLVVETTNFSNHTLYRGASENMKLIEHFTVVDPHTLDYEFTVVDPTTFVRPWTAAIPYVRTSDQLFEYACHEGNYGMEGILLGARTEEAKAAGETKP
jgi:hypothetical protein